MDGGEMTPAYKNTPPLLFRVADPLRGSLSSRSEPVPLISRSGTFQLLSNTALVTSLSHTTDTYSILREKGAFSLTAFYLHIDYM